MSKFIDGIKHLNARWKADSPALFKKITNSCVTAGTLGAAMLAPAMLPAEAMKHIPVVIPTIGGYLMAAGYVGGFVSKFTCQDPTKIDKSADIDEQVPKQ